MKAIVNVSQNNGIGFGGELLFHLKEDMRFFRKQTSGKTVILGRKTLATLPGGRGLPNRRNLVLTNDREFSAEGIETVHSLRELALALRPEEESFVIGGAQIYRLLLPYCGEVLVTETGVCPPADCFFPELAAMPGWRCTEQLLAGEEIGLHFRILRWRNDAPLSLPGRE